MRFRIRCTALPTPSTSSRPVLTDARTHSTRRPIKRPRTIQFGILSPEEIKAVSVCKVEYPETFEEGNAQPVSFARPPKHAVPRKTSHHSRNAELTMFSPPRYQKPAGLSDPRLGTIDRNFKCATCGEGMAECPGHFGHIELSRAVYHVGAYR